MILLVIAIAAVIGIVAGAIWLRIMGLVQIRWWVIPTVCLLGLVGMPMTISTVYYPSLCKAAGQVYLAPWIIDIWRNTGYLLGLGCFIIVSAFCFGLGMRFTCSQSQRKVLLAPIVVLCLASFIDTLLFLSLRNSDKGRIVAESISPDGARRILCIEDNWLDTSFRFIATANVNRPLTCKRLPSIGFDGPSFGDKYITWSTDSQLMCLWVEDVPAGLYDFTKSTMIQPQVSWVDGISKQEAEAEGHAQFSQRIIELFSEHGGVFSAESNGPI